MEHSLPEQAESAFRFESLSVSAPGGLEFKVTPTVDLVLVLSKSSSLTEIKCISDIILNYHKIRFYYFSNFCLQTSSWRPEIANISKRFYHKNQAK